MNFKQRASEIECYIRDARRYLHQNAELPYEEHKTTAFLVSEMTKLGIPVQTFDDYTGCIATIAGDVPGKTVLLRADIDALPIHEDTGLEFSSLTPNVMHACGHDCHASMLLGAAHLLWEQRHQLSGTVKLLFQAAEEAFVGSHYYVDEGHLENIDAAMGMHVWPSLAAGTASIEDGPRMASCDNFVLTVHGTSAHGSTPQMGCDAIVAASQIITNIQTIVSRLNDPRLPLVVTIGKMRSGTQFNIISDTAVMEGTVRSHAPAARAIVEDALRNIATSTAAANGCTIDLQYDYIEGPTSNNDIALNDLARNSAKKLFGDDFLCSAERANGSEDFSYIMEKIPSSLFIFLGCNNEELGYTHPIHNEKFMVDEKILPLGAAQYAQFAADYLESNRGGSNL